MTKAKQTAYRFRRLILFVGILYTLLSIAWIFIGGFMGTPIPFYDVSGRWGELVYRISTVLFLSLIFLAQSWFLRPCRRRAMQLNATGRPLKSAVIIAAFMAMLLTVGAISVVLEIFKEWISLTNSYYGMITLLSMLLIWFAWAGIFYVYWRQGDRYTQFGKMVRGLVAGSVIEAMVAIPVHIAATRKSQCFCEHGSYTSLVFSGTVLLWAFGPGIYLLYKREKYRQQRLFPVCDNCGYDLRASKEICPECGTPVPTNNLEAS